LDNSELQNLIEREVENPDLPREEFYSKYKFSTEERRAFKKMDPSNWDSTSPITFLRRLKEELSFNRDIDFDTVALASKLITELQSIRQYNDFKLDDQFMLASSNKLKWRYLKKHLDSSPPPAYTNRVEKNALFAVARMLETPPTYDDICLIFADDGNRLHKQILRKLSPAWVEGLYSIVRRELDIEHETTEETQSDGSDNTEEILQKLLLVGNTPAPLESAHTRALNKLSRLLNRDVSWGDVLDVYMNLQKGVHTEITQKLSESQIKGIKSLLEVSLKLANSTDMSMEYESPAQAFDILIERIGEFAFELEAKDRDLFLSRLGFFQPSETLENCGEKLGLTRERARQKEKQIMDDFRLKHPGLRKLFTAYYESNDSLKFDNYYEEIQDSFESRSSLIRLMDALQENIDTNLKERLEQAGSTVFNKGYLLDFFCSIPKPRTIEIFENYLRNETEFTDEDIDLYIFHSADYLEFNSGIIDLKENVKLTRVQALGMELLNHPKGMPWQDLIAAVNASGRCTALHKDRVTSSFRDNPYLYQVDRGAWGHVYYLDLKVPKEELLKSVKQFIERSGLDTLHLTNIYEALLSSEPRYKSVNYWELRYLVRDFGGDFGLYFKGKSNQDTVSLDENASAISQHDMIIEMLKNSETGMTKQEIASKLRSKSIRHANFYIDQMMTLKQVVRVDELLYMHPDVAYKNTDIDAFADALREVLYEGNAIKEGRVVQEKMNYKLKKNLPIAFYLGFASHFEDKGFFRKKGLLGRSEIPYNSITDLVHSCCRGISDFSECRQRVAEVADITQEKLTAVYNLMDKLEK